MSGRFTDRRVLVTGGSGGIGGEICRRFATEGARVFVHYSSGRNRAEQCLAGLPGSGRHEAVQADLLDAQQVADMIDSVVDAAGGIDILVNNAGIYERHPPVEARYEEWQEIWRRTLGINLIGAANACHRAAHHMIRAGTGGRIVNISSRGAFRGEPDNPAYGASKAALNSLSQSLALALAPHRIFVYAVAPGFVETAMARPYLTPEKIDAIREQSPLHRVAKVQDVAYWVLAMADDEAEFATGAIVDVNGASYLRT
ncbi:MAG: SDR family oxidoreductase [Thermoanaerobaculia bacterium]|nr:SDR family oxidoreductase [Thermoanaerobaculia bacterium]